MTVGIHSSAHICLRATTITGLPPFLLDHTYPVLTAALGAGVLALLAGLVIGAVLMRLSGVAATIATLAVLFIVHVTYSNWESVTRGKGSLVGLPTYVEPKVAFAWAAVAIIAAWIYQTSRFGLAVRAAREDEVAARACGVNIYVERVIAFVLSAFFVGIGGVLHAHYLGTLQIDNYFLDMTLITLAMLVIGGQRSLAGAVVGVLAISFFVEALRQLENGVSIGGVDVALPNGAQQLALALAMLVCLILRPSGLMGGRELTLPWPRRNPRPPRDPEGEVARSGA